MTEAASAAATAQKLTIVDPQQWHALRAGMPADMLAQVDACVRLEAPALEDEDEADDGGPLADPVIQAAHAAWRHEGHRAFNMREADAIAWAAKIPAKLARDCSAALYRLGGGIYWKRTQPEWAADLAVSVETVGKVFSVLFETLRLVRRRIVENNVATYTRDDEAIAALTYAYGEASGVDWQGYAPRFGGKPETVKPPESFPRVFHGSPENRAHFGGKPETRIQGLTQSKTPAAQPPAASHNERSEGDEDEPATPTPPPDHEAAADALIRACGTFGISHEPDAVRSFCRLRSVTTDEAAYAASVARNATADIDGFAYLKKVIENARKEGRKNRDTPIGGHANPALTAQALANLNYAKEHPANPATQAAAMADITAALRGKRKAFTQ